MMQDKDSLASSISSLTAQLARKSAATPPPPSTPAGSPGPPPPSTTSRPGQSAAPQSTTGDVPITGTTIPQTQQAQATQIEPPPPPAPNGPPLTPRRLSVQSRLSVQMPTRGPLSPVIDPALGFSVARRPRLDFARACTSLHHSTLAESSPDSSPLASNPGYPIPRNGFNRALESPISSSYNQAGSSHASSLGSASMMDYPQSGADDSSGSSDDDLDIDFDLEMTTPLSSIPMETTASMSLRNHQKARLSTRNWRKHNHPYSHPSSSGNGLFISPSPTLRAIPQFFPKDRNTSQFDTGMRRESISLGPSALEMTNPEPPPTRPALPRPVSRRGSMLPKSKNFQRIKAALIEESCPVDVEVKREAEITRQIREDDEDDSTPSGNDAEPGDSAEPENTQTQINEGMGISFSKEAQRHGGFWFGDQMEGINGSPPAFPTPTPKSSADGDIVMNSDSTVNSPVAGMAPELRRTKRRRTQEDLYEPSALKRRAVSPGVCGSPILAQSPPNNGRRINFQGMNDTHDGLMKMSLQ